MKTTMKFPYGICDFKEIITNNYFYCDRTSHITLLEQNKHLLFIRPRRFGKSLLLSTLFNYYDVASTNDFQRLFGRLEIGKKPTRLHNEYFVLEWDFSCVDPFGSLAEIRGRLHDHVNARIADFQEYYSEHLTKTIDVDSKNALNTIQSLITAVRKAGRSIYLLIDEYDNFANQLMMGVQQDKQKRYEALVFEDGPLRTLFKVVKSSTSHSIFDRIFITGASPVVMSDITSGHNIAKNIYLNPLYNNLCGFTQAEVDRVVGAVANACNLKDADRKAALAMSRTWYNGYKFAPDATDFMYNPTLILYFCDSLHETHSWPSDMLDENLSMDHAKLSYVAQIPGGRQLLLDIVQDRKGVAVKSLARRFGVREMLTDKSQDHAFKTSLLYYLGVLSLDRTTSEGKQALKVPNLVVRKLYVDQIAELLLPHPEERDQGRLAAERLHQQGDMAPLADFVEQHFFKVFHNPDYRWANELTVKTAFLTLLYNDILYIMDSEPEIGRRRVDLTMIIRPDMRRFEILDILIEFKYVSLSEAGVSGQQARDLTGKALQSLPAMQRAMAEAVEQARNYGDVLEARHGNLRLRCYAVASLGFDRICWAEVNKDQSFDKKTIISP